MHLIELFYCTCIALEKGTVDDQQLKKPGAATDSCLSLGKFSNVRTIRHCMQC